MKAEKPIQLDFSLIFQVKYCLAMMGGSLLTSLILYAYLDHGLGSSYFDSLMTLRNLEQALPSSLIITFVIQLVLILILTIAINLFVSHKIGGPVYRYEHSLKTILKGDLRLDVRTREGDQLKSMVTALNDWQGSLRQVFSRCHRLHEEVNRNLERVSSGESPDVDGIRSGIEDVRQGMGGYLPRSRKVAS